MMMWVGSILIFTCLMFLLSLGMPGIIVGAVGIYLYLLHFVCAFGRSISREDRERRRSYKAFAKEMRRLGIEPIREEEWR